MLKTDVELESSAVVANCAMNRERGLAGANSYHRALGLDPCDLLRSRLAARGQAAWVDLCSGEANALIEAAGSFAADGVGGVSITGVDLVGRLGAAGTLPVGLELIVASVTAWRSAGTVDLVTCVHGLHYVGDKLTLMSRAGQWLVEGGLFVADFDPATVRYADGRSAAQRVTRLLREAGAEYDSRRHRVRWCGPVSLDFGAGYLGSDDEAGPGYTGQPAVASYYSWA